MKGFLQSTFGRLGYRVQDLRKFGRDPWRDVQALLQSTPAPICFDVGAHRGETVKNMLEHLPAATIHAFEPDPENFAELQAATANLPRVKTHLLGMDERPHKTKLLKTRYSECNSLLSPALDLKSEAHQRVMEVDIDVTSLDQFCQDHKIEAIDFLKTDCQGLDLRVLRGAAALLAERRVHVIQCECLFHSEYSGQGWFYEILEFLTKTGYAPVTFRDPTRNQNREIVYSDVIFKRRESA